MTAAENLTATERMAKLKDKAEQDAAATVFNGLTEPAATYLRRVFELSPGHTLPHSDDPLTGCECPMPDGYPLDMPTQGWLDIECRQMDALLLRIRADRIRNAHQHQRYTPEPGFRLEVLADALVLLASGHAGSRIVWEKVLKLLGLAKMDEEAVRTVETALLAMEGMEAPASLRFPYGTKHPRISKAPGTVCDGPDCGGRADADTEAMLACFDSGYRAHVATDDIYAVAKTGRNVGRATMAIDGKAASTFGSMMVATAYTKLRKHPGPQRVTNAAGLIRGLALEAVEDQHPTPLPVRATTYGDGYLIDLGADGRYVHVTAGGWRVIDWNPNLPVMLAAARPLPVPTDPGKGDPRLGHLGFTADDPNWHQIRMWQATAFFCDHERQLMMLTGGSGSGKTKRAQSIAAIVDPLAEDAHGRAVLGGPLPEDDVLGPKLLRNYLFTSDNLSDLDGEESDRLCRIATGYQFSRRVLYTTADTFEVTVLRAGLMTGIDVPPQLREDAQNRLLHLELNASAAKRASGELDAERRAMAPVMFGALLNDMVAVLRAYQAGEFDQHDRFPIVACAAQAFGPEYASSRVGHQRELARNRAEGDTQLAAVAQVVKHAGTVLGDVTSPRVALSAAELHQAVLATTPRGEALKGWSVNPNSLADRIKRNAATLAAFGITVDKKRTNTERYTVLTWVEDMQRVDVPPPAALTAWEMERGAGDPGPFRGEHAGPMLNRVRKATRDRLAPQDVAPF